MSFCNMERKLRSAAPCSITRSRGHTAADFAACRSFGPDRNSSPAPAGPVSRRRLTSLISGSRKTAASGWSARRYSAPDAEAISVMCFPMDRRRPVFASVSTRCRLSSSHKTCRCPTSSIEVKGCGMGDDGKNGSKGLLPWTPPSVGHQACNVAGLPRKEHYTQIPIVVHNSSGHHQGLRRGLIDPRP